VRWIKELAKKPLDTQGMTIAKRRLVQNLPPSLRTWRILFSAQSQLDLSRHKAAKSAAGANFTVRDFGLHSRHTAGSLCRDNKKPVRDLPPLGI